MKKLNLKNKKGFTLVELLAVIVVLAIIILIAMPSVMSAMDKARRNALITEATEITKIAATAFADDSMGTGLTSECYSLQALKNGGYLDKNLKDYSGSVSISIDSNTGAVTRKIWLSNGIYKIVTKANKQDSPTDGANPDALSVEANIYSGSSTSSSCGK